MLIKQLIPNCGSDAQASANASRLYSKPHVKAYSDLLLEDMSKSVALNTKRGCAEGHTHLRSFSMAKTLIDNCIKHKRPKTNNPYIITSHIRVSDDDHYIKMLHELIDSKKKHNDKYKNGPRR